MNIEDTLEYTDEPKMPTRSLLVLGRAAGILSEEFCTFISAEDLEIVDQFWDAKGDLHLVVRLDSGGAHPDAENGPHEDDILRELYRYTYFLVNYSEPCVYDSHVYEVNYDLTIFTWDGADEDYLGA